MTTLARWRPFREMMNLREEMDRLMEEAFDLSGSQHSGATSWGLSLDVAEDEDHFIVKASIPGVNPDDIDVTIRENVLTVQGEVTADDTIKENQYHLRERRYGMFARSITLPVPVVADDIEATYEHGVLTLHIPKAEEVKPRRIQIKANSNGDVKVIEG